MTPPSNDPRTAVCNLLDHFGIEWRVLTEATITVSSQDLDCVIIKTTRKIYSDDKPIEFDNKTYKITVDDTN